MNMALGVCAIGLIALGGAGAAPARKAPSVEKVLMKAIAREETRARITPAEAAYDRSAVTRAVRLASLLPPARRAPLQSQLAQAVGVADKLTAPRALAVFGQLTVNDNWFATHGPVAEKTDITDADGLVYRYFTGGGFELHPLANFSALNADVANKNVSATARLGLALVARGVPQSSGGTGWEYYFNYAGGHAPWLSGFAQSVAAQAFARAAVLAPADAQQFNTAARSAFRAIPGHLDRQIGTGPWIKLYSFTTLVVLNAQLQSAISLADYAAAESDSQAATLATNMKKAAATALPLFDTGYWTYYSLPHNPSSLSYQEYVVDLLQRLAKSDPRFAGAAARFAEYQTERPAFRLAGSAPGAVEFWVSKPATIRISALDDVRRFDVTGGWHTVSWKLPQRAGVYPVTIHATDWAGNEAAVDALPIVRVAEPPKAKRKPKKRKLAGADGGVAATLPSLAVGVGLEQPTQASLATQDGFHAVQMTLVWPAGASVPDPGAVAALDRLPPGTRLFLDLYASPVPTDAPGRAALAAYAAAVAQQVRGLTDLIVDPAPTSAALAANYEAALAAIYDAVKSAAPAIRIDGALDGTQAPRMGLSGIATAYLSSGRTSPFMDALAFHPAPAAGSNLLALSNLPTLLSLLDTDFGGTGQGGESVPLIIDELAYSSAIPAAELPLYDSSISGETGLEEPAQATAYADVLRTVACRANVTAVLIQRLVDGTAAGDQSGLYYADSTPKTSLQALASAVTSAQSETRGCATATTTSRPSPTPTTGAGSVTTPAPAASPASTVPTTPVPAPTVPNKTLTPLVTPGALVFPSSVSRSTAPVVRVRCTRACLYLVALRRAGDGAPVLARRGSTSANHTVNVTLPMAKIKGGRYRFSVWLVASADPGPIAIQQSGLVRAA